jgi:hypothetical protein
MSAHLLGIDIGTSGIDPEAANAPVVHHAGCSALPVIPLADYFHYVFVTVLKWV